MTDTDFASRVHASFDRQAFMTHLGARLTRVEPGLCEIEVPFRKELTQQHEYFHAGVIGSIADSAGGYAAYSLMPADSSVLSVEYKVNLLTPAVGDRLIATAKVVRSGRTISVCSVDVSVRTPQGMKQCATALMTMICLRGRSDEPGSGTIS